MSAASVNPASESTAGLRVVAKPKDKTASSPKGTIVKKAKPGGAASSDQQRRNYVEVAAYYIAERRGFQGGSELEDWAQAEREVDRLLRGNPLSF